MNSLPPETANRAVSTLVRVPLACVFAP